MAVATVLGDIGHLKVRLLEDAIGKQGTGHGQPKKYTAPFISSCLQPLEPSPNFL